MSDSLNRMKVADSDVRTLATNETSPKADKELESSDLENVMEKDPSNSFDIPDGGYGWVVVLSVFLMNANTWGANSGFAIYLSYYLNHGTFAGADKYDYALIGGLTFGTGLLFAPIINWLNGKIGTRPVIILGNCCQFTALMLASFSKHLWQLYLTQGVLQAFGLALISLPAISVLPQWFKKRRNLASAIGSAGSGIGGLIYNLGMQKVIQHKSVFWALRCQAIMCFGLTWIAIALMRTRLTKEVKFTLYDVDCLKSAGFWILVFYLVTCMFGYVVVLYQMANVVTSMGYSAFQGSIASAMIQAGSLIGRPTVGYISDRFGAISTTCAAYFLCGIFVFAMWIPARNLATIIAFCFIMGSIMGSIFATMSPILSKMVGLKRVNIALCMSWVFLGLSGMASPVIGLSLKTGNQGFVDPTQYLHSSIFAGCSFIACSLSLLLMRGYLISREGLAGNMDSDLGHLHISVPFAAPVKNCLKLNYI